MRNAQILLSSPPSFGGNGNGNVLAMNPPLLPQRLIDVQQARCDDLPLSERFDWLVGLCGQIVQGGVYLCAGAPGSNKSTLARQIGLDLARNGHRALFLLTEEPASRLKVAVMQMTADWRSAETKTALSNLLVETAVQDLEALPGFFAHHVLNPAGAYHGVKLIVLDSIQGSGLSAAATRKWQALYQFAALTRASRITTILIAHVNKRHDIAGPKAMEHNIDAAIVLRKAGKKRHLGIAKNRFGPEVHRLVPLELDEQTLTLSPSPHVQSMTTVAKSFLPGIGLAEVQGAVTLPRWGSRAKVMAPNLPRREIEQLIACISQIEGIELDDLNFSVQCRLPGERRYNGVLGLPLCLSLVASFLQKPIPSHQLQLGEVDLCRSIRDVPQMILEELAMVMLDDPQLPRPLRILAPPSAIPQLPRSKDIELLACRRLDEALYLTWPELR